MREYFLKSARLGFSNWREEDIDLARTLWGAPDVTKYICATGVFTEEDISARLAKELSNFKEFGVQYYPMFDLESGEFAGVGGFRPYDLDKNIYEMGIHLRKPFQRGGYGTELAKALINYGFGVLGFSAIFGGHHPNNEGSRALTKKLGFTYIGDEFYEPTGLYHPSYMLKRNEWSVPVRRKDREVTDFDTILSIIDECEVMHVGLYDEKEPMYPYVVPVNFGYKVSDGVIELYFHGAVAGRKYELLTKNGKCTFQMEAPSEIVLKHEHRDITTRYRSVMGKADVKMLEGDEIISGIEAIIGRREDTAKFDWNRASLPRTAVFKLTVTSITAKANKAE